MNNPEFNPVGIHSLLKDKGNKEYIIARKPNGEPIRSMGGGCSEDSFCNQASMGLVFEAGRRSTLSKFSSSPKSPDTVYREMLAVGDARINKDGHAELTEQSKAMRPSNP